MDDEIPSILKSDSCKIVPWVYVSDHNIIPGTGIFRFKSNSDYIISKAKACYFVRVDVKRAFYIEPWNVCSPVVKWATEMLMFILKCILGWYSQIIEFTNAFIQAYITRG